MAVVDEKSIKKSPFAAHLQKLDRISRKLKKLSKLIVLLLLGQIVMLATSVLYRRLCFGCFPRGIYEMSMFVIAISILILIIGVILLFQFQSLKSDGMILYEEITEEIDWSDKRKEFIYKPPIDVRILIKEFLKSTDLPFTSGNFGQAFYLVMFVLLAITTLVMSSNIDSLYDM